MSDLDTVDFTMIGFIILLIIVLSAYPVGRLFSAGYHKGKEKFMARMRRAHCDEQV